MKDFSVAYSELAIELLPECKKKKGREELIYSYYPVVRFNIALFRSPAKLFMTTVLPLLILQLLTLTVTLQSELLGPRVLNLGVLLLAFFAFQPTLRSLVPNSWKFNLIDQIGVLFLLEVVFIFINSFWQSLSASPAVDVIFGIIATVYVLVSIILVSVHAVNFSRKRTGWESVPQEIKQRGTDFDPSYWGNKRIEVDESQKTELIFDHKTLHKKN